MKTFLLFYYLFLGFCFYAQDSAMPKEEVENNVFKGKWVSDSVLYELYGDLFEDKDKNSLKQKGVSFISEIEFFDNGLGYFITDEKNRVDFEFSVRKDGGELVLAYGSRFNPGLDYYSVKRMSDGRIFLKSKRLSKINGTMYITMSLNQGQETQQGQVETPDDGQSLEENSL